MLADKILQYIATLPQKEASLDLRGSGVGYCARKLGYQRHGYIPKLLSPRTILTFELGNTIEDQLVGYAKKLPDVEFIDSAGIKRTQKKIRDCQREVSMVVDGELIKGHIDGIVCDDDGNDWVVDFKSINTRGFTRASKGDNGDEIVSQLNFYIKALRELGMNIKGGFFTYYNKDTSHLCEQSVFFDETVWQKIEWRIKEVINSTSENLPPKEYGPNDKGAFPYQCSYCTFSQTCWPESEVVFDKSNKPIMKLK